MFLYKNAIECLIENIPELKSLYEEDQEYYEDLPYVFYESVFTKMCIRDRFRIEFDVSRYLHYHFPSLFGSKAHIPLSPIIDSSISRIISNYFLSEE